MNKINYSKETEKIIHGLAPEEAPTLLLHSCCAPCSSAVLEYLREYFRITVFYYNPNISPEGEYQKRLHEEKRLIAEYNHQLETGDFSGMKSTASAHPIRILDADYNPNDFFSTVRGMEDCPEGGERCFRCYALRLDKTAEKAEEYGFDFFTTTLTISPLKNAAKLNELGFEAEDQFHVKFLPSDFKKKDGYKRSIELSGKFGLYRQNFCGCVFSKEEARKHGRL